jgi:hypothetical protein
MFMLIFLNNTNKKINRSWFRMYPKAGPVSEAAGAPIPRLDIMSVWIVWCSWTKSLYCRWPSGSSQEILMFTWGTQLQPPGTRQGFVRAPGSRRSSRRMKATRKLPKNLIACLSQAGSQGNEVPEACSCKLCACRSLCWECEGSESSRTVREKREAS